MADYCLQCIEELFGGNKSDFEGTSQENWDKGLANLEICEGCGCIQVDTRGRCISDCIMGHGDGKKAIEQMRYRKQV